ncbi:MAG: 4-hydroxybenzoate 3-monooxygenase [Albidovulum sp.]|nr:4-hydroxybenzoate 3-monooxygenase [Albidovulum sp.]MDE0531213.1 4-hydroxybenzoate 3-monooxygenase [Albidovulum sp.]
MRTQVGIIGGGPAGLLLALKLFRSGIDSVVIERRTREYVLSRIRAGVLEWGTVEQLRNASVNARMDREGLVHDGCTIFANGKSVHIDFKKLVGKSVMIYGQTEITRDLYNELDTLGVLIFHGAEHATLSDLDSELPSIGFTHDGDKKRLDCDFVAGCDGFYGPSRQAIPANERREFEKIYPFGWLGILSETVPVSEELIYSGHERGFALCSMRNPSLSRYYIQVPLDDKVDNWSDDAFWNELALRLPKKAAAKLETGRSVEKSIAPLRSFVSEPMSWGRLFLCGDAAHIVPPTGAKGLNLATSDVYYLHKALCAYYRHGDSQELSRYSRAALERVWHAMRFSWRMTTMLHRFPERSEFENRIKASEIEYLATSRIGRQMLAENYTGLPY